MKEIPVSELMLNTMTKISDEWMLITAGCEERGYNTMTASWGHLGSLWGKHTSCIYIRPQRYTKEFIDREELFTLSFYKEEHKPALGYLGKTSGRDGDKAAHVGFTPVFSHGTSYFEEADFVFICRKMSRTTIAADSFIDKEAEQKNYPDHDWHDMYIAEIMDVLVKED